MATRSTATARCSSRRARSSPVTVYRQPEPPKRSRRSLALAILGWALASIVVCVTGVAGGAYL